MSSRSRPRYAAVSSEPDPEEERRIWSSIQSTLKELRDINVKAEEVAKQIIQLEKQLKEKDDDGEPGLTVEDIMELQNLYRSGVKLAEDQSRVLTNDGIVDNMDVLIGLRDATARPSAPAISNPPKLSSRHKRKLEELAVEIPGRPASPLTPGLIPRVKSAGGALSARAASIPIKIEAENTPTTPSADYGRLGPEVVNRLQSGTEIAFRPKGQKPSETEWILGKILTVKGEGLRRHLRIQDAEEDDNGKPGKVYQQYYNPNSVVLIPPVEVDPKTLLDYSKGQKVMAKYPDTTCLYEAEIVKKGSNGRYVLKFEGETEADKEVQVDRRYVLEYPSR